MDGDEVDDPIAAWNDALLMGSLQQMAGLDDRQAVEMDREDVERLAWRKVMAGTIEAIVAAYEGEEWKGKSAIDVLSAMLGELAYLAGLHDPKAMGEIINRPLLDVLGPDWLPEEDE